MGRSRIQLRRFVAVSTGLATAAAMVALTPAVATAGGKGGVRVVASGLDNPRGLTFANNGTLYVAEAGKGGAGPCFEGPEGNVCFGTSGAITKVSHGKQKRIVTGMPSTAAPDGSGAIGPSDVDARWGDLYFTIGLGADPALRNQVPAAGKKLATLQKVNGKGKVKQIADLGTFEATVNPDGDLPDSNPNGLLVRGDGVYVADAGGNSIVRVRNGKSKAVAVFPERTVPVPFPPGTFSMDPVPTSVVKGPDGAFYVSELTGFPFPVDGAQVWRVKNGKAKVFAKGFTNIIDLAFDNRGRLYVLEINSNGLQDPAGAGSLIRVGKNGKQTVVHTGLIMPGGVALRGGAAYVTNCGVCAGGGTVLRIPL
ncbi:ScyD/ScyE family protein [Tenggerimyces flavus]|uniref:ScyD/ScyE family protein n=1 Tax=Tenggerimyces flavus TaxID=1708749 RepID=A0ABV7YH37_9ACTN|nr:ScyD/ScyE family protein [Tenggerimyces flavus]MBM7787253.1 sugar lactone lactonase YvrE [Tenggerimyces flavus]